MSRRRIIGAAVLTIGLLAGVLNASASPASAATAPARNPVVVVGGMLGSGPVANLSYVPLMTRLNLNGWQTYLFTNPDFGLGDIHANAVRLNEYIDWVRARTGAAKVDIVTHSQGGLIARDYIKNVGGAQEVGALVSMSPTNHGTALANLANYFLIDCLGFDGCAQQAINSPYLNALNAGDDSIGDVRYTMIATKYDEVVIPYTSSFLNAADGNIANITVQNQCPLRILEHGLISQDGAVADGIMDALRRQPVHMNCWAI